MINESTSHDDILSALNAIPRSPLAPSPSSSLTGKYLSHSGGSDLIETENVKSKQVKVICIHEDNVLPLCLGLIGLQKNSFCLKNKSACKISTHSSSTFTPELDHFYICKNQHSDSAWSDFSFSEVESKRLTARGIDFESFKSLEDWKLIFSSSPHTQNNEIERAIEFMKDPQKSSFLMKTPAKQRLRKEFGLDDQILLESESEKLEATAALLHLTQSEKADWESSSIPHDLVIYIENLGQASKSLFSDIGEIRLNMNKFSLLADVASDLVDLTSAVTGLKAILGKNSGSYPDVWTALTDIESSIADAEQVKELLTSHHKFTTNLQLMDSMLKAHGDRWKALGDNWLPLIAEHETKLMALTTASTGTSNMDLLLRRDLRAAPTPEPSDIPNSSMIKIATLEARLQSLEDLISTNRSVSFAPPSPAPAIPRRDAFGFGSAGVSFKQYYFADENAVKIWMKENLSSPCHGLFVDLVSFTQFFGSDSYVERNVTLNELYMSNKIGYQTMADAYVATSFENVLPAAYGRNVRANPTRPSSDVDMESQPELPGLPSFEKWDRTDGSTGRKYWITKECRKTGLQIDGMIRAQLSDTAQFLAKDLLTESIAMSEALFNFISTSYQDTYNSGRFDTVQAWQLTCKFVKRIFVEMGNVRIIEQAGIHINEPWTSAAKFLFATLRAHEVMHSFMRLDIKNHPSISSEMVKFICYSQPASDTAEVLTRLAATESMQRTHQSNLSKLELKSKKIDVWKADTDKLLKKIKDKVDIA